MADDKQIAAQSTPGPEEIEIDLRDPKLAALLAWLIPGAGHLYQRRYQKAAIFFVCILGTFLYGLLISGGHTVYASFRPNDRRFYFIGQFFVGAPATLAIVQAGLVGRGREPLFGGLMAPPTHVTPNEGGDQLAQWHAEYPSTFEIGTVFTFIAGLLNVLAIFDAYAGPAYATRSEDEKKKKSKQDKPPPDTEKSKEPPTEGGTP